MAQRVCDPGKDFESFSEWSFWWRAARAGMPKVERASYEGIGLQKGQLWIQGLLEEMEGFTTRSWLPETSKTELESDFVLLAARQFPKEFGKVDWLRNSGVDATDFNRSYWSSLAVAGQDSPILNARLLLVPREGEDGKTNFSCEVSLLSGASFACQLANSEMLGPFGSKRPGPLLNDLAKMLVEELPRCTEVVGVKHIFLAFQMSGNADSTVVTPWEW
eukprot:CAMPEP_0206440654 /NCGR_PEP_ID=MMETSP0324_2-20121206/12865_1 /ASSEMBLY_ACC=CAM_ASM_000836 /TAXON_ID=2866 /ORGANISM="Crypthecodinium cohnii, Strain Seligo" /LENGTH=218 /DNA_ID=CAMNT_0053908367 /DNA_START=96 /DNA_END=749 /DNA_ORIENTATION=-